jgi:hypothetical protein
MVLRKDYVEKNASKAQHALVKFNKNSAEREICQ